MAMLVRLGGSWQTITGCRVYASGAWRQIVAVKVYASGAWRSVANFTAPPRPPSGGGGGGGGGGTIAVSISPSSFAASLLNRTSVSQSLTATPSGGLAPYTYAWTVDSSSSTVTFTAPTAATTYASMTVPLDDTESATLRCTVTDSLGTTAHATVAGTFTNHS